MHFKEKDRLTENKLFWDFCKRRDGEIITEVVVNLVWWLEWISQWTWNLTEEEERNLFRYDMCVFSHRSIMSNSLLPCGLWPTRVLCPWGSPGKNTGVGCHALCQGIFLTQGLSPGLPYCRWILYHLSYQGNPGDLIYKILIHDSYKMNQVESSYNKLSIYRRDVRGFGPSYNILKWNNSLPTEDFESSATLVYDAVAVATCPDP